MEQQQNTDPTVLLRLPLSAVNAAINALDQVAGTRKLVNYIVTQVEAQLNPTPAEAAPPAAAPAETPAEPPPPKPVAKSVRKPRAKKS